MIRYVTVLVLSVFALGAWAQNSPPHQHPATATTTDMIDGSVHPEMIQDKDAYRLFLQAAALGPNPTTQEKNRQRAILAPAKLSETELAYASKTLGEFKAEYEAAVQRWNTLAEAANASDTLPDIKPFLLERDAIVQTARQKLEGVISPQSMARFHAYVQGEKSKMKVAKEGAQ
jgi:hypothetical protein